MLLSLLTRYSSLSFPRNPAQGRRFGCSRGVIFPSHGVFDFNFEEHSIDQITDQLPLGGTELLSGTELLVQVEVVDGFDSLAGDVFQDQVIDADAKEFCQIDDCFEGRFRASVFPT